MTARRQAMVRAALHGTPRLSSGCLLVDFNVLELDMGLTRGLRICHTVLISNEDAGKGRGAIQREPRSEDLKQQSALRQGVESGQHTNENPSLQRPLPTDHDYVSTVIRSSRTGRCLQDCRRTSIKRTPTPHPAGALRATSTVDHARDMRSRPALMELLAIVDCFGS